MNLSLDVFINMNICPNCNIKFNKKTKYCSLSCRSTYNNNRRDSEIIKKISKSVKIFSDTELNKLKDNYLKSPKHCKNCDNLLPFENRHNNFCGVVCSNKNRKISKSHRLKTSSTIIQKSKELYSHSPNKCKVCDMGLSYKKRNRVTCSKKCLKKLRVSNAKYAGRIGGKISTHKQKETRRSKNEILFSTLCKNIFSDVINNQPIFNGWDADVIIPSIKIAVLWNGVWHYKKITKKHSVKQVQNRDSIKIKEIKNLGYNPYIIKDMGKYNENFVKEQFNKFVKYVKNVGKAGLEPATNTV